LIVFDSAWTSILQAKFVALNIRLASMLGLIPTFRHNFDSDAGIEFVAIARGIKGSGDHECNVTSPDAENVAGR
jgi:hypothetical protein